MTTLPTYRTTAPAKSGTSYDYILVDGSGSMMSKWWDTMDAIEAYVQNLKAASLNSQIVLTVFDSKAIDFTQRNAPLSDWVPINESPILAGWCSTPLYDAINSMGRAIATLDPAPSDDRPGHILIVTDGDENASRYTDLTQAASILDWLRAKGWQITFMGCDFNNIAQARALGANDATAIGVQQKRLADATTALAEKRKRHAATGSDMHYTDAEKQQFGGYLNAPK